MMKLYLAIVLLILVTCDQVSSRRSGHNKSRRSCVTDVNPRQCPLLDVGSNIVTIEEFETMIPDREWLSIYTVEIGTTASGKTINRWTQTDSMVRRETSFPLDGQCTNVTFDYVMQMTDCGIQLNEVGVGRRLEKFWSQDLSKYFWWFVCIEPTNNGQDCDLGFFDLRVRDRRAEPRMGEINLDGLPWGKIAADLKQIRNLRFDDNPGPIYAWLGQECPFTDV